MAQYSKTDFLQAIRKTGMVPVFYHPDTNVAMRVLKACYDGGVRVFEFTNRDDAAHGVFAVLAKYAASLPGMILGAGSIVDPATAALYIQLGANFIVGPLLNPSIAPVCNRRLVPYCPGCGSVSEVGTAQELGCDLVKLFPGDSLGPAFVKALMAPMPWSNVVVTGGVKPEKENLEAWFKAGTTCVGMGSNLFPEEVIARENWAEISRLCSETLAIIREVRGE